MSTSWNEPEPPTTSNPTTSKPATSNPAETGIASFGPLAGLAAPRPLERDPDDTNSDRAGTGRTDPEASTVPLPSVPGSTAGSSGTVGSTGARPPVRIRTVVFGLVLLAIAGVSLLAALTEVRVDGAGVLLVLLVGAGLALLGGGIAAAAKEARGGPGV